MSKQKKTKKPGAVKTTAPGKNKNLNTKKQKVYKRDEFRTYKPSGHPAYIYEADKKRFKFIGITHSSESKNGDTYIKLTKNPNPEDKETAYAKPYSQKDKKNKFKEVKKGWKLSKKDKTNLNKKVIK